MGKKTLEVITESMFYILMAFSQGECCGTDIADWVARRTGGRLKIGPATLYTILGRFEAEKLIREVRVEGRKRTYVRTDKGLAVYREELERLERCLADARETEKEAKGNGEQQ